MAQLTDFMVSRVRSKLLTVFLQDPEEMFYVRQLTRKVEEEINAVRRELERMQKRGMVKSEPRGNRLYYFLRKNYPFYQELLQLVAKTSGLGGAIRKNQKKLGKIKFVMLSGKFIRRKERQQNEVDLLVVGNVVLPQLAALVREEEARLDQEINYTVMNAEEFEFRRRRRDPFLTGILSGSRIMIIGGEDELVGQE
jgi:glutamate synthase domain-containing protein 1